MEQAGGDLGREDRQQSYTYGTVDDKEWDAREVGRQRLLFNPWYQAGTCLTGRSSLELEVEAARWSRIGLRTWDDVTRRGKPLTAREFRKSYPGLEGMIYEDMLKDLPDAWKQGLSTRATSQGRGEGWQGHGRGPHT